MSFNGNSTVEQINNSMNSMLLLHSSCQAIIQAEIQQVDSEWYNKLDQELGEAENLVINWRQNGYLYFHQLILQEITNYGQTFLASKTTIDALFKKLSQTFSEPEKQKLITALKSLMPPLQTMIAQISQYQVKLQAFEKDMQKPHSEMNQTIAEVQEQEDEIQSEINSINAQIKELSKQIQTDRKAIAKAKKARTRGIVETIFGVLLAPISFGASLVLAGIGVATIAEAEGDISNMKSQIGKYQKTISGDQTTLSNDQKTIATLKGLSMSTEIAINDIALIGTALDNLRLTWGVLNGELQGEVQKLDKATTAQELIVIQAWYNAACIEWNLIITHTQDLNSRTITTTHVNVG